MLLLCTENQGHVPVHRRRNLSLLTTDKRFEITRHLIEAVEEQLCDRYVV